ncbi:hypothetical protein K0M31_006090 [Melipona bicolor]|uniref:Uncharacterized protein n=1 Tax=Melipona bicolor TaxID=60889 RepID=A0AA40FT39_9HYME|nr:hypothetical protein K0M31_006090 [Melipona bicolor]
MERQPKSAVGMMQEITDQSSRTVLLNTFVVKKKRCRVYFHRGTLIWETEKPPYRLRIIDIEQSFEVLDSIRSFLIRHVVDQIDTNTFSSRSALSNPSRSNRIPLAQNPTGFTVLFPLLRPDGGFQNVSLPELDQQPASSLKNSESVVVNSTIPLTIFRQIMSLRGKTNMDNRVISIFGC